MKFELDKAKKLSQLFSPVTALHDEGNFVFAEDSIILMQTDLAKVSMVKLTIAKDYFKKYVNEDVLQRRFDVSTPEKWIGSTEKPITVTLTDDDYLRFSVKGERRWLKVPAVEGFEELPVLPGFEPDTVFSGSLSSLKSVLNDCTIVSEDFIFISDNDTLTIKGESPHLGEVKNEFKWGKTFEVKKASECVQGYNALLFLDFIKALEKTGVDKAEIEFGRDQPLHLKTGLGKKSEVKIEYTLGSLIMPEEEEE